MKRYFFLILTSLLLVFGCNTIRSVDAAPAGMLVHVECKNEYAVGQSVLQLFRTARLKDIHVDKAGYSQQIEGAYTESSKGPLLELEQELKETAGVMDVDIKENTHPVSQTY